MRADPPNRFQFGLRGLLIAVTLLSVWLWIFSRSAGAAISMLLLTLLRLGAAFGVMCVVLSEKSDSALSILAQHPGSACRKLWRVRGGHVVCLLGDGDVPPVRCGRIREIGRPAGLGYSESPRSIVARFLDTLG